MIIKTAASKTAANIFMLCSFAATIKEFYTSVIATVKKIICWGMVAACMVVIFSFSAQTSGESLNTSNSVIETLATILNPDFPFLDAAAQEHIYSLYSHFIRKLGHFSIYALLGFLVSLALWNHTQRGRRILLYTLTICSVYAITDEIHQMFVPGRGPGVWDVVIDSAGALCGSCIIICILYIIKKIKRKRQTGL